MSVRLPPRARVPHVPIHDRMRAAREASGMTQKAVARRLFVSPNTVTHWESGRRLPHVDMLDAYLKIVGATITLGKGAA